jgi:hypothetical protein
MNAAFVPHTAFFDRAVKDVLTAGCTDRFAPVTQKEPRNIVAPFTLTLRPPVVSQLLEQTLTQWQYALLATLCVGKNYVAMVSQMPAIRASS